MCVRSAEAVTGRSSGKVGVLECKNLVLIVCRVCREEYVDSCFCWVPMLRDQFDLSLWRGQVSEKSDDSSDAEEIPCLEQVPSWCTGSENDVAIPPCANDEEVVPVMPKPSSAKCSGEAQQSEPSGRGVNVEGKSSKESKALDVEVREQTLKQPQAARRAVDTKPLDAVQRGRADEKGRKKKVESASEPSHSRAARKMRRKEFESASAREGKPIDIVESGSGTKVLDVESSGTGVKQSQSKKRGADTQPPDAVQRGRAVEKARKKKPDIAAARERNVGDIHAVPSASDAQPCGKVAKKQCRKRLERAVAKERESEDGGEEYAIEGMPQIVQLIARAWFPSRAADLLDEAAAEVKLFGPSSTLRLYGRFTNAFLCSGKRLDTDRLEMLFRLSQIRNTYTSDFLPLSKAITEQCLWSFARAFILTPGQMKMMASEQDQCLRSTLKARLGCVHRLRAMIRLGLQRFDKVDFSIPRARAEPLQKKRLLLELFIEYILEIEECAEGYRDASKHADATQT